MPGPSGPGAEGGKEFHPILPVAGATGSHCVGPPGLEEKNPGLVLVCSLSGLRGHDALCKSQVLDTMRSLVQRQLHTPYRRMPGPTLSQHLTSCLPKAPAPEGRHYTMPGPTGPE
jgi:hypothetical protein